MKKETSLKKEYVYYNFKRDTFKVVSLFKFFKPITRVNWLGFEYLGEL